MTPEALQPTQRMQETAMLAWMNDFAPYGVVTTDQHFCVQTWNRWMATHTGKGLADVFNRNLFEIFPDILDRGLRGRFDRALSGEISVLSTALHGFLFRMNPGLQHSGFADMQQTARIAPLVFENRTMGVIIVVDDVTQREFQTLLLRRQHERDSILSWALAHLLEAREPKRSIRDLFCKIAEQSDFDGYLLYLGEPPGPLRLHAFGGIVPEVSECVSLLSPGDPLHALLTESLSATAWEHLYDPGQEESLLRKHFGFQVGVILPLHTAEGALGVLCLGARNRPALKEGELELLTTIAKYLAVALHKDATNAELQQAQSKLNQHAQDLEKQVHERTASLREIIAELETFSYTLAHDLRAPIRALTGYSEALLEDYSEILPDVGISILKRLRDACIQLDALTHDLLEFSKVSRQDIRVEPVAIDEVINNVLAAFGPAGESVIVNHPLHPVLAHRGLLQQCLWNLIDNGLKFVREGEKPKIVIWTELHENPAADSVATPLPPFSSARQPRKKPEAAAAGTPRSVRLQVQDEGIGIPLAAHGKIFGIFERGTSSPQFSGSGIGLAIVARAVQKMGGTCGVDSEPDKGSRFWIEFPAA